MPKKYGILTFHNALNYGAVLQAFALQQAMTSVGKNTEIINYCAEFNEKRFLNKKLKQILNLREIYNIIFRNSYVFHYPEAFEKFYSRMSISQPPVYDSKKLKDYILERYDTVVCGSDQIWNLACTSGDDSFFLPFDLKSTEKKAYAASFGVKEVPLKYQSKYREWIKDFSLVSVREAAGKKIIKDLLPADANVVLDPSMLLTAEQWREIEDTSIVPSKPYVFMYLMSEDKEFISFAKRLAKNKGLKLIYINDRLIKHSGMKNLSGVSPERWLALIDNAAYVVTNSFHGTAFSINFGKEFFVKYIPRSVANSRLENILNMFSLQSREITSNNFILDKCIDGKKISSNLEHYRTESYKILSEV